MGKTNISDYRFSIFINNDQAKKSLIEMENVMRGYEAELQQLVNENKRDSAAYREKKKILDDHKAKMVELRKEAGLQALSLKELKSLRASLYNEMARTIPGSEHRSKLEKEFNAVNKRIGQVTVGAKTAGMTMGKMADGFNRFFGMVTAGIAVFAGFALSIKTMITKNADLDDSLANIRKTTGMTTEEVKKFNMQFGKINTRTGRQELREMAVVAGQLGIAKQDIFGFTESVDKLNVALGDEFKGGAEEVATEMGKLRNVLTDMKTTDVADDMLRIGNAVNELGAAGFATGPVVADFASRIGGVGIAMGLSSDEVLGLSATLQELNVNAERGGTAVVKILLKMTQNIDGFAKVAGMSTKEFKQLVNTDLYGAFVKVIEGSRKSGASATALSAIIKELEVKGVGASEVFAKLGTNTDLLAEKVTLAGKSLQGTDSVMAEFNIKNTTLGATIAKLQKDFYSLITLPGVTQFFKNQVYHVVELVNWLKDLPLIIEKYKILLIAVTGATLAWIAAKTRSIQIGILQNLMLKEGIGLKLKDQIVMTVLIAKEELMTIWKGKGTIATKLATTAQYAWNAALKANPIGLLIIGVTALIAAIKAYEKYNSEAVRLEKIKASTMERLNTVNSVLSDNYKLLNDQIRNLNQLSIQEKKDLQDKIDKNIQLAESELLVMEARQRQIEADSRQPSFWDRAKNAVTASASTSGQGRKANEAYDELNAQSAFENGRKAAEQFDESLNSLRDNLKNLKSQSKELGDILNAEAIGDAILGKSQGELEEKLRNYQVALKNTVAGSKEYLQIQQKIKDVNKELSKFSLYLSDDDKTKKLKTDYEKLNDQVQEYMTLLQQQVQTDPAQAKVTAEKIERIKAYKKHLDDLIQSLLAQAGIENGTISSLTPKGILATSSPLPEPGKAGHVYNPTPEDSGDVQIENFDMWAEKLDSFLAYADAVYNGLATIDQLMANYENAQLARDERVNDEKKNKLKRQLDAGLITRKKYDQEVAKLDQEMDAKKRKMAHDQAVRNKELALMGAIIATAQGVAGALASAATLTPIGAAIMAILIGLLGAVQIGLIASTPVPEARRGRYQAIRQAAMGSYDVIGQSDGKYYPGVPYDPKFGTGIPGHPLLVNETGDEIVIDPETTKNLILNYPEVINAINMARVPQRATGSYVESPNGSGSGESAQEITIRTDPKLLEVLERVDQRLQQPLQGVWDWDYFVTTSEKMNQIENDVRR